jgi:choline dehydrogenase
VIVSSGAINSPRLLMLSGIGDADELRAGGITPTHELKGLGRNLQDHLCWIVHVALKDPISYDGQDRFPRSIPMASNGFCIVTSQWLRLSSKAVDLLPAMDPAVRVGQTRMDGHGFTVNTTFLQPRSVGSESLASADSNRSPVIDPNYHSDPKDREMSLRSIRAVREILSQSDIDDLYLLAHEQRVLGSKAGNENGLKYIEKAIALDPNLAPAYATRA